MKRKCFCIGLLSSPLHAVPLLDSRFNKVLYATVINFTNFSIFVQIVEMKDAVV